MPRVHHVKKARKDQGRCYRCGHEIKAGESYYWWANRIGRMSSKKKNCSQHRPKPSETTGSAFYSQLFALQEGCPNPTKEDADNLIADLQDLMDECQNSLDSMPESLQYSPTGELLQERIDALDNAINEMESAESDDDVEDALFNIDV